MTFLLAIDIGNTRISWALFREGKLFEKDYLDDLNAEALAPLIDWRGVEGCVFASVVPAKTEKLRASLASQSPGLPLAEANWDAIEKLIPHAVKVRGMAPGADRAVNAYRLYREGLFPAVSVDAGTALTTEIINKDGIFLGGVIVPGARLQFQSLARNTAQLGGLEFPEKTDGLFGDSSETAMANGIGQIITLGMIELLARTEKDILKERFKKVVFTGGGAELYHAAAKERFPFAEWDPDFTLKALEMYFKETSCV